MEFLVIVLFIVAILVVNFLVTRAQRRKHQASGEQPETQTAAQADQQRSAKPQKSPRKASGAKAAAAQSRTSVEGAREANARLDAAQHQQVYAAIAQGHPVAAVKLYAKFTGVGVRASAAAVENLAMHPQPFQPPRAAGSAPDVPAAQNPGAPAPLSSDAPAPHTPETDEGTPDPSGPADPQAGNAAAKKNAAASTGAQSGPAGKTPATPEEDEISKWVKDLRPEDF